MTPPFWGQFKPFGRRIARYFQAYGGWRAIFGSPLFIFSVLVTALSYSRWLSGDWAVSSVGLLPNLLGFSLGTYAILFSLITARVKDAMRAVKDDRRISTLEQVNATFFHFIFVQVIALLWALASEGTALFDLAQALSPRWPRISEVFDVLRVCGAAIGFLLLVYSVTLMVGAALAIYRLALIVDPAEQDPAGSTTQHSSPAKPQVRRDNATEPGAVAPRSAEQLPGQARVDG